MPPQSRISINLGKIFELAKAEFKIKNEGSYLGIIWYLINPILMFILLLLIFSNSLGEGIKSYPLYLFLGVMMLNLFQQTTIESLKLIENYKGVLKSVKLSKHSLVISVILKNVFSHIFEILILIILIISFKSSLIGLIVYPLILILFGTLIFGISLILSSITVFFIDLENIWIYFSRILWFATPIFYNIEKGSLLFSINMINPLYYFITATRQIVLNLNIEMWIIYGMIINTIFYLMLGIIIMKKLNMKIVENIK